MADEKQKDKEKEEIKKKSSKSPLIILVILVIILVAFFFGGRAILGNLWGRLLSKFISNVSNTSVEVGNKGEKVTVKTEEGEISFEERGELPDNFPKDFPVYPKSKLVGTWSADGEDIKGLSLVWETDDSVEEVSGYYNRELEASGWKVTFSTKAEGSVALSFEKDKNSGFVGITTEDGKTIISVTLGVK